MQPRKHQKQEDKEKIEKKLTNPDNLLIRNIKKRIKGSKFNQKGRDFLGVKRNEALRKLQESMK